MTRRPLPYLSSLAMAAALAVVAPRAGSAPVTPGTASAVQREQAQQKFLRGKELFTKGKYEQALIEFRASIDIVASPNARLYLARSLREVGRLVEAYVEFGRTAVEANELAVYDPRYAKAGESAGVERKALEKKLGFVSVTITSSTEETKLKVAGEEVRRAGWGEPIPVVAGSTEFVVETPGRAAIKRTVTLNAGDKQTLEIDVATSAPDVAPPKKDDKPAPGSPSTKTDLTPYGWVGLGVGAAGMIGFSVFGAMTLSKYSQLKSACGAGPCPSYRQGDIDAGKTDQKIANISLVVGIVGLGTGALLMLLSPKGEEPKAASAGSVEWLVGPGSLGVRGAF